MRNVPGQLFLKTSRKCLTYCSVGDRQCCANLKLLSLPHRFGRGVLISDSTEARGALAGVERASNRSFNIPSGRRTADWLVKLAEYGLNTAAKSTSRRFVKLLIVSFARRDYDTAQRVYAESGRIGLVWRSRRWHCLSRTRGNCLERDGTRRQVSLMAAATGSMQTFSNQNESVPSEGWKTF